MGEREKERDGRVKGGEEGGFNESDRAVTRDVQRREPPHASQIELCPRGFSEHG